MGQAADTPAVRRVQSMFNTGMLCSFALLAAVCSSSLDAAVFEYENEGDFLADIASFGYATLVEDFEGPDWDHVRSDYPAMHSAPFVMSKGITWTGNEEISTNQNWGRFGTWGIFTIYEPPFPTPDELFGDSVKTLYAVGGWFDSNPDYGADIAIEIEGQIVAETQVGSGHHFVGVIKTEGFTVFRILDVEQEAVWGADDFTFGVSACPADITDDGIVDVLDLLEVLAQWGTSGGGGADITGDGIVDVLDLLEVLAAWGPCE